MPFKNFKNTPAAPWLHILSIDIASLSFQVNQTTDY